MNEGGGDHPPAHVPGRHVSRRISDAALATLLGGIYGAALWLCGDLARVFTALLSATSSSPFSAVFPRRLAEVAGVTFWAVTAGLAGMETSWSYRCRKAVRTMLMLHHMCLPLVFLTRDN